MTEETFPRGGLSPLNFVETNPDVIRSTIISEYERISNDSVGTGSSLDLFFSSMAYVMTLNNTRQNDSFQQNFLTYATGEALDHLGFLVGVTRLDGFKASAIVRFKHSGLTAPTITIPAGFQVSTDDGRIFQTLVPFVATSGLDYYRLVEAVEVGTRYNGVQIGYINTQVNPNPYIESVSNSTISENGADSESDERYAKRIRDYPSTYSVAGPRLAYTSLTFAYDPNITDVYVDSPVPGQVDVYYTHALENYDGVYREALEDYLSADTVRPLTDFVQVLAPVWRNFLVDFRYTIGKSNEYRSVEIIESINNWFEVYRNTYILGEDLNGHYIIQKMLELGAKRILTNLGQSVIIDMDDPNDANVFPFAAINPNECYKLSISSELRFDRIEED